MILDTSAGSWLSVASTAGSEDHFWVVIYERNAFDQIRLKEVQKIEAKMNLSFLVSRPKSFQSWSSSDIKDLWISLYLV